MKGQRKYARRNKLNKGSENHNYVRKNERKVGDGDEVEERSKTQH